MTGLPAAEPGAVAVAPVVADGVRQLRLPLVPSSGGLSSASAGETGEPLAVDRADYLHARWLVTLRERFYREHQPDLAAAQRRVFVVVPVPPGWRLCFGQRAIRAFGCTGSLLT